MLTGPVGVEGNDRGREVFEEDLSWLLKEDRLEARSSVPQVGHSSLWRHGSADSYDRWRGCPATPFAFTRQVLGLAGRHIRDSRTRSTEMAIHVGKNVPGL